MNATTSRITARKVVASVGGLDVELDVWPPVESVAVFYENESQRALRTLVGLVATLPDEQARAIDAAVAKVVETQLKRIAAFELAKLVIAGDVESAPAAVSQ